MFRLYFQSIFSLTLVLQLLGISSAAKFDFVNQCTYTVWPAMLTSDGKPSLAASATGFALPSGTATTVDVPTSWSGRLWARTHCTSTGGNFTCATGDCATGSVECTGSRAHPPATLAEFTLNGSGGMDSYDVSLVDGYNVPIMVQPAGGSGNCTFTSCTGDLNGSCPKELEVVSSTNGSSKAETVACKSACQAFGDPQYCCSGPNATPESCKPNKYSEIFKSACPGAYSYAYDDKSSTFNCQGAAYVIAFCPTASPSSTSSGTKSLESSSPTAMVITSIMIGLITINQLW